MSISGVCLCVCMQTYHTVKLKRLVRVTSPKEKLIIYKLFYNGVENLLTQGTCLFRHINTIFLKTQSNLNEVVTTYYKSTGAF